MEFMHWAEQGVRCTGGRCASGSGESEDALGVGVIIAAGVTAFPSALRGVTIPHPCAGEMAAPAWPA